MFGRKKENVPPKRKGADLMNQMGYSDMGEIEQQLYGDLDDDAELEAELLALQGEPGGGRRASPRGRPDPSVNMSSIHARAAEAMRDIGSDEDVSDTDDPDLLAELQEIAADDAPPSQPPPISSVPQIKHPEMGMAELLEDRLQMYRTASENARAAGDSSKQRRLDRGTKTIQDLLKKAKANRPVAEDDIPPPVALGSNSRGASPVNVQAPERKPAPQPVPVLPRPAPSKPEPVSPPAAAQPEMSQENKETYRFLVTRRDQYKQAALKAKHTGDITTATQHVKVAKQFDNVIKALEEGKEIDLSQMPPPPQGIAVSSGTFVSAKSKPPELPPEPTAEEEKSIFKAPNAPKTVLDALQQRLEKYKQTEEESKSKGETSKARRYGRIVKQYQDAIKAHKAGKPVDYEDLPSPPGFAPIPVGQQAPPSSSSTNQLQPDSGQRSHNQRTPSPARGTAVAAATQPQRSPSQPNAATQQQHQQKLTPEKQTSRHSLKRSPTSRAEQQANFLSDRMNEYKQAALKAKKSNEIELAKKYMRIAKGFEPMIQAAESGLPVDMSQIPPSLDEGEDTSFVMVQKGDVQLSGDRTEVYQKLEQDLINQIRICATNSQHFTKLGDVVSAAKFDKMENGCRKDLDALKNAFKHSDPVPKFHYENKTFSLVQCNTDLGDNDLEFTIIRGIQYNLPEKYSEKDLDTFIKFEFPFPTDDPQAAQSDTVKGSCNPEYKEPFKVEISRKSRAFARVVERKTAKCEIYYKRGFLKSDKLIGTANIKLQPLDNKCTVHDSYDITDGRRSVGGKLEVKMRIRDPFKSKQVEEVKEKWLVIDQFFKTIDKPIKGKAPAPPKQAVGKSQGTTSLEVLKYEKQQLDLQIASLRDRLTPEQTRALMQKSKLITEKMEDQQEELKKGGADGLIKYVEVVMKDMAAYEEEARHLAKLGDMHKAQIILTKKKHAEKEILAIKNKYPQLF
ncbi:coiled-coil and C2 domain-containing protein 1-like isoform X2 [Ostrea edulis]|uniref:coiled-coil and C2 domain-containing protein 1-like isoform X2 n=1 Tax=Ostrea edulis TaxID=37623 RepID=UPI002096539C|nr:coiled-coil and C2 domain-containing protein 1-like isoform X2 [Ostrea edulis]